MQYRGKRTLDLTCAIPAFLLSLPIQLVAATAIRVTLGRPVLFSQVRPGFQGKPFIMRKFRTMHPVDPSKGWISDDSRITKLGSFLRSTSIDELPTIWNIIKGDMSLVGPRPLLISYLDRYSPEQARRMDVRPGLTGLAQVSGRNAQSWDERFLYDIDYVEHSSFKLDLTILLRTISTVVSRRGISAEGQSTMPEFIGNKATE